jgi:hypothetical protein
LGRNCLISGGVYKFKGSLLNSALFGEKSDFQLALSLLP